MTRITGGSQVEAGLTARCKYANERLDRALALTIAIAGRHYDESVERGHSEGNLTGDLAEEIQALGLKTERLIIQLNRMIGQF